MATVADKWGLPTEDDIKMNWPLSAGMRKALVEGAAEEERPDVFVAHSSDDNGMLPYILGLLKEHGFRPMADITDEELRGSSGRVAARTLKSRIRDCRFFVLLASDASVRESRWTPWELGIAEALKPRRHVLLLPIANAAGDWGGVEYLHMYNRIVPNPEYPPSRVRGAWRVVEPNGSLEWLKFYKLSLQPKKPLHFRRIVLRHR